MTPPPVPPAHRPSRLGARPDPARPRTLAAGRSALGLADGRDGLVRVPDADGPLGLVVLLHGAGSSGAAAMALLEDVPGAEDLVLVAPDARGATWDVIERGGFGPDVAFLDAALVHVFAGVPVDPARVALAGFSDGASYALSLGLPNGDLVSAIVAFSPGFLAPDASVGRPRVYVTHGAEDRVLPIDRCSRRLVPALADAGYDVTYREFDGGHAVPPELAAAAVAWLG